MTVKQVIVMRADLGMRKGKMIAQGAHASMAFLSNGLRIRESKSWFVQEKGWKDAGLVLSPEQVEWFEGLFTKVCVRVDSEEELMEIYLLALDSGLTVSLIEDAGLTEFNGVKTKTCLAIGPHEAEKIDPITGELKLL